MKRTSGRLIVILLIVLIILIPLLLINAWGMQLAGDAYRLLHYARALAEGSATIFAAASEGVVAGSPSMPLDLAFTLMVSALSILSLEPVVAAAFLSALGWSAAAFAFLAVGKAINRLPGSAISALLLCFNPFIITTTGTPASWIMAFAWWAFAFLLLRRYFLMLAALIGLVLMLLPLPPEIPVLGPALTGAMGWTMLLFLLGIGAGFAARWMAKNVESADLSGLFYTLTLGVIFVLAGGYQLSKLSDLFQAKPLARWVLEDNVAAWLEENTPATAVVGASEKIGYLAGRRAVPLESFVSTAAPQAVQDILQGQPLHYLVADDSLPWQLLANSRWFRLNYRALAEFENPYVAGAPYTIWGYQPPPPDFGPAHALNARLPNRLRILGYQVYQEDLQATNEAVLTLYLEAAANTAEPTAPFSVITRLLSPLDGRTLAEWDLLLPNSLTSEKWGPGEQIREQITIKAPPDLEPGAYPLNISLAGPESAEFWPISLDNDIERLDRLPVGYLVVPAAVDEEAIGVREAAFGETIKLLGSTLSDTQPGEALELTLYWQANEPLEGEYVVFTHVLDGNGQLVASHDSVPGSGSYPAPSWLPGMTIVDPHLIQLPPDLPTGDYEIRVGLYDPASGQRLPAVAADGSIPPDNAFPLLEFSIAAK